MKVTMWTGKNPACLRPKMTMMERIVNRVSSEYEVTRDELTGPRRTARIAWARQMAMTLARRLTEMSLVEVGEYFGKRDHGTVIHAGKVVRRRCDLAGDHALELGRLEMDLMREVGK